MKLSLKCERTGCALEIQRGLCLVQGGAYMFYINVLVPRQAHRVPQQLQSVSKVQGSAVFLADPPVADTICDKL